MVTIDSAATIDSVISYFLYFVLVFFILLTVSYCIQANLLELSVRKAMPFPTQRIL